MTAAVALNPRPLVRNTLRGFFDLALPSGMILKGCTLHAKRSHLWVGLPGKPYKDASGAESWVNVVDFRDRVAKEKFQTLAIAAAREAFLEIAGAPPDTLA